MRLSAFDQAAAALATLLMAALLSGLALLLPLIGAETGRRLLVLHATLAGVLLPLALRFALPAGASVVLRRGAPVAYWGRGAWSARAAALVPALAPLLTIALVVLLAGSALCSPAKPLLTTFLPAMTESAFALLPGAGIVLAGNNTALARLALLVVAHALPLALLVAGGALLRGGATAANAAETSPHPASIPLSRRRVFAATTGALGAVATLAILLTIIATPAKRSPLPDRLPQGETPRQHVDARRRQEIAQRFAQGVEMMRRRQFDFAAKAFHRVLELDPTLSEAHVNMGFALLETGDPAAAQRFFESATRLKRDQLNAYYGLALAASAQQNHEVAVGAMRTWLHLAPAGDSFRRQAEVQFDAMRRASQAQRP